MIPEHTDAALASLDPDLVARLRFVLEADALKGVLRRNSITDGSRRENTGEHSWHLALMALVLAPYSREPVDIGRVIELLLLHDIVEIDAGDTFVYDTEAREQKEALEQRAADRLFAMVPGDDGSRLRERWDEFEASETAEARFAHSLDRLAPLLLNHANRGELWADYGITADRVIAYNAHIADGSEDLWTAARTLIDDATAQGWLPAGAHLPE
jgi:5'-deoxynucleotidase YfbR-like HD superfamily hydrolase